MIFNDEYNKLLNYLLNTDEEFAACFESARVLLSKEQLDKCKIGEEFLESQKGEAIVDLSLTLASKKDPCNGLKLVVREKAHPVKYTFRFKALNKNCLKEVMNSLDDKSARFTYRDYEFCSIVCNNADSNIITSYTFYLCQVNNKYKLMLSKMLLDANYLTTIRGGTDKFYDIENVDNLFVEDVAGVNV